MMAMFYKGKEYDSKSSPKPIDKKVLNILWGFTQQFRGWILLALCIMLAGTATDLLRPYLLKVAIDEQVIHSDLDGLIYIAWLYGASIVVSFILSYGQSVLLQYIGQRIIFNVRQKVFRQLLFQNFDDMDVQPVGRMVTRVTNDTDAIRDLYTDVLVSFASDIFVLVGIIIVMLLINWQLALLSFIVLPVMLGLAVLYQYYARVAYRLVREKTSGLNTYIQESLNGIAVIKSFARFQRTEAEYHQISQEYLAAGLKEMRTFAVFRPLVDLVYSLAIVLVLWYSGWLTSGIEAGVIVAFLRYVEKFFWPIKDLAEKYSLLQSALAAAERVWDLISTDINTQEEQKDAFQINGSAKIQFENVWFAYEGTDWVLQDVTFTIQPGEFVGIAGMSGSGKTTLLSLLLRFYDPQQGKIFLDGIDIQQIPVEILRQQIGAVFQDVHLFKGSISDNIRLYNPAISCSMVEEAAKLANIHQFIKNMPQGYDTAIGYQGAMLSMGERQLLSLARAIAPETPVLALDEATSSIDSETEGLVQKSLANILGQRTLIVVAHRLSTISAADHILVLHKGKIVEEGVHDRLLQQRGFYYQLYNSQ